MQTLYRLLAVALVGGICLLGFAQDSTIGAEKAVLHHLEDGREFELSTRQLLGYGHKMFSAKWTVQDGAGRPKSKGTANGSPLTDLEVPLLFPHNFNRISGPDASSCSGCHNQPGIGSGGDRATSVFVLASRFDFVTFDRLDGVALRGSVDERGEPVTQQNVGNERRTVGMNGSGYIELLAREMTADLEHLRDLTTPGHTSILISKGVHFGMLRRNIDGSWDSSQVEGLPHSSVTSTAQSPPSLIIMPFHQSGSDVSLRQFTDDAFTLHFGMQAEERVGLGIDQDQDGFVNELTRADITAAVLFQASLPVPGQVIPRDPEIEAAVLRGKNEFLRMGCATCHIPSLPLNDKQPLFVEPGPYNPPGTLQAGDVPSLSLDLSSSQLPGPRLKPDARGVIWVNAFTDMKLHDITNGPKDPNWEPLDENEHPGSSAFFAGNGRFLTRRLWGVANSGPYMHHGSFTTMREAILAHSGEASFSQQAFVAAPDSRKASLIEFLKTLQVLPEGTLSLVVDETGEPRAQP